MKRIVLAVVLVLVLLLLPALLSAQVSQAHVDTLIAQWSAIRPHNQSVTQHRILGETLVRYRALAGSAVVVAEPAAPGPEPEPDPEPLPEEPRAEPLPLPEPEQPAAPLACTDFPHTRRVAVSTSTQLSSAITNVLPGDLIHLADGTYGAKFTITRSGTVSARITLCGSRNAILRGGGYDSPAPLRIVGASHLNIHGFTVQHGLWGIQLERSSYNRLSGLLVHDIGQEAVSIRDFSTYNVVEGNEIRYTGRRTGYAQYGEGVYLGTWSGRWPDLNTPDRSDYNQILNNKFGPHIPGDHMDAKEGTSFTVIRGNTFDATGFGAGMAADQGVDAPFVLQSNDAIVENNTIIGESGNPRLVHGIRVWTGQGGWGRRATFRGNTMDLKGASGYGIHVHSGAAPTALIECPPSNTVVGAGAGLANVPCS